MKASERFAEMATGSKEAIEDFNDFMDDQAIAWADDEMKRLRAQNAELLTERNALTEGIGKAVISLGIAQNMPMAGPELLLMLDSLVSSQSALAEFNINARLALHDNISKLESQNAELSTAVTEWMVICDAEKRTVDELQLQSAELVEALKFIWVSMPLRQDCINVAGEALAKAKAQRANDGGFKNED